MRHRLKSSTFNDDILSTFYEEKERIQPKVCFLSGVERDVLPRHSRGKYNVGPGTYNIEKLTSAFSHILGKVTSKAGYGGLASKTPRFVYSTREVSLPVKRYDRTKSMRSNARSKIKKEGETAKPHPPFGSSIPRKTGIFGKQEDTPGFNYDITRANRKREMEFDHSFGGRTKLKPYVTWKCTPENNDTCGKCQKKPVGDYYISGSCVLCLHCFTSEWNRPSKYSRKQLYTFKPTRDCSEIHEHGGTTAAIPLMSNRDIRKLRVLESYFATFASPRKVVRKVKQETASNCMFSKSNENKLTVVFEGKHKKSYS